MSARTRRKKTSSPVQAPGGMQPVSRPAWEWRTFPVYFAFAAGGFIGLYMGLIAGLAGDTPFTYVAFTFWAILLGFGFSRITSRWMMNRGWGRRIQRTGKR